MWTALQEEGRVPQTNANGIMAPRESDCWAKRERWPFALVALWSLASAALIVCESTVGQTPDARSGAHTLLMGHMYANVAELLLFIAALASTHDCASCVELCGILWVFLKVALCAVSVAALALRWCPRDDTACVVLNAVEAALWPTIACSLCALLVAVHLTVQTVE